MGRVAPIGEAAAVDPFGPARLFQRPIRRLLPRLAGRVQPVPSLGRPALTRPALRRGRGVVPLEPLLGAARDPVIAPFGEHQVRVGVLPGRAAAVEGERIGQPLPGAHPLGERVRELPPPGRVQFARQGELDLAVAPPVGALMRVRRRPVGVWVVLRPRGHVAVLYMLAFLTVRGIAPLALDVLVFGAGGLPTGARTEADLEVIDRHAVTSVFVLEHSVSRRETGIVRRSHTRTHGEETSAVGGPTPPAPHPHPPDPPRPGPPLHRRPQAPHPPLDPNRLLHRQRQPGRPGGHDPAYEGSQ